MNGADARNLSVSLKIGQVDMKLFPSGLVSCAPQDAPQELDFTVDKSVMRSAGTIGDVRDDLNWEWRQIT